MRGGFRMLSALDTTGRRTAWVGLRHALLLLPLGMQLRPDGTCKNECRGFGGVCSNVSVLMRT